MTTVNEMLRAALTTDSRKKKCAYQSELEAMGYEICKDGRWMITNKKNGRYIYKYYDTDTIYCNSDIIWFTKYTYRKPKRTIETIDLQGLLDRRPYIPSYNAYWYSEMHTEKFAKMENALSDRKYHKKQLEQAKETYKKALEEAKRKYEHDTNYNSRRVIDAENAIKNLLNK